MSKVFLYGGCVIRDAYENIREEVELQDYVARQSLISAINMPAKLPEADLGSPFQSRMINGDIKSSLIHKMKAAAPSTDLFVMDCHVERSGVYLLKDKSFITKSVDLRRSKLLRDVYGHTHVQVGSARHTAFYEIAARRFVGRLEQFGLKEKTLVIDAPWANMDDTGAPFELYEDRPIQQISEQVGSLARILEGHGLKIVRMPDELAVGKSDHQWGRAPFHFGSDAMEWVSTQMTDALN